MLTLLSISGGAPDPAAPAWIDATRACPLPGRSYLVLSSAVGMVADVAYFHGPRPAGGLWWIMTDIELPAASITHFAPINYPGE